MFFFFTLSQFKCYNLLNLITLTLSVITFNIMCNITHNMKICALFTPFRASVNNYLE